MEIIREVTPLTKNDCFTIFSREKKGFDFPLHNHDYIELNLILNGAGARRIVGNHIGEIGERELVFVGPNLVHGWFDHNCKSDKIKEVTIQFHKDLLNEELLGKNQLVGIRKMFENAKRGVLFPPATVARVAPRIMSLYDRSGFESMLELLAIMNELSFSTVELLADTSFVDDEGNYISRRIGRVFDYMNNNFHEHITLAKVSTVANMAESSFSRYIKNTTGKSFVDNLNDIRLGHVTRMLIDTNQSIGEISYKCGFNNTANFNRIFKRKKGMTPKDFRESFIGKRVFV